MLSWFEYEKFVEHQALIFYVKLKINAEKLKHGPKLQSGIIRV